MDRAENIIAVVCEKAMPILNEYQQRILAGCLADGYGHGGKILVSRHSTLSRNTRAKGAKEIHSTNPPYQDSIRKTGAGRKSAVEKTPELLGCVDSLLQETTYGDPMRVISYSTLSLRKIASAVGDKLGIEVGKDVISRIVEELGYSKQRNQKMEQLGEQHPDRDSQFRHINETGKVSAKSPCASKPAARGSTGSGINTIKHCRKPGRSRAAEPAQHPAEPDPSQVQRIGARSGSGRDPGHSPRRSG